MNLSSKGSQSRKDLRKRHDCHEDEEEKEERAAEERSLCSFGRQLYGSGDQKAGVIDSMVRLDDRHAPVQVSMAGNAWSRLLLAHTRLELRSTLMKPQALRQPTLGA